MGVWDLFLMTHNEEGLSQSLPCLWEVGVVWGWKLAVRRILVVVRVRGRTLQQLGKKWNPKGNDLSCYIATQH